MDPTMVNSFVIMALMLLGVASILLVSSAVPLMGQANRTLIAFEKLADTLQNETTPTLRELNEVLSGVNKLRTATTERISEASHKVEDVTGSVNKVATQAKQQSSVFGAGILAGVRAYLTGQEGGDPASRQISASRGEENVQ